MENTTDSAKAFLLKWRDERTHPVSTDYFAELLVAYASQAAPKLVLPSEEWIDSFYPEARGGMQIMLEKIKLLNPHITE